MPKIIKDAKKRITDRAVQIFLEEGFEHVDIRRIAKDCQIGVGTVYNYFPNKTAIMTQVFQALWNDSFQLLDELIESAEANAELLVEYAHALYREMAKKNGIGKLLLWLEMSDRKHVQDLKDIKLVDFSKFGNRHSEQIKKLLQKSYPEESTQLNSDELNRLAETTLLLLMTSSAKDQSHILFVRDMVEGYIQKRVNRLID